jgi:hypothetical protein
VLDEDDHIEIASDPGLDEEDDCIDGQCDGGPSNDLLENADDFYEKEASRDKIHRQQAAERKVQSTNQHSQGRKAGEGGKQLRSGKGERRADASEESRDWEEEPLWDGGRFKKVLKYRPYRKASKGGGKGIADSSRY